MVKEALSEPELLEVPGVGTVTAGLVARGGFRRPGVHPPEVLGAQDGLLASVLGAPEARGVGTRRNVEERGAGAAALEDALAVS